MRRPIITWTSALAAAGLSAGLAMAQQSPRAPMPDAPSSTSGDLVDPMMASRAARYLLRNGMDYLAYREYDRALSFFRTVEARQNELNDAERAQLKKGIARAQQGKREAINSPRLATAKGRGPVQPGGIALAPRQAAEPVQLTAGTLPDPTAPAQAPAVAAAVPLAPGEPIPVPGGEPSSPAPMPKAPAVASDGLDLPTLPAAPPAALPDLAAPPVPAAEPAPTPTPTPSPASPAPADPSMPLDLPTLPSAPAVDPSATPARAQAPDVPASLPGLPAPADPALPPMPASEPTSAPMPAQAPEPPPAPEAGPLPTPEPLGRARPDARMPSDIPDPSTGSLLSRHLREEVERIAQRPGDIGVPDRGAPGASTDPSAGTAPAQGSTRLELPRAPSPTEARPLRRIPVPEEFTPLEQRDWSPNRKYWAPAGTCHMILYFQDPVLERYGQGVEQALGPRGRFFSYPLDDPKQSNQRNQILQPFYSIGKFCFQVGTLPYKLVVDPPWESEYDLGYYRPGDKIPTDTIMMTPTGIGPPLVGRKY